MSDSALHLFLQSDLSTKEIDAKISEEREENNRGGADSSGNNNNNNIQLSSAISINHPPLMHNRPYLFRSVSLCSASPGDEHEHDSHSEGSGSGQSSDHEKNMKTINQDFDHYCDISTSSEEYEIDVEA